MRIVFMALALGACGESSGQDGDETGEGATAGTHEGADCLGEDENLVTPVIVLEPPYEGGQQGDGGSSSAFYESTCTVVEASSVDPAIELSLWCLGEDGVLRSGELRSGSQLELPFEIGTVVEVGQFHASAFEGASQAVVRVSDEAGRVFVSGGYDGPGDGTDLRAGLSSLRINGAGELVSPSVRAECPAGVEGRIVRSYQLVLESGLSDSTDYGPSTQGDSSLRVYEASELDTEGWIDWVSLRFEYLVG